MYHIQLQFSVIVLFAACVRLGEWLQVRESSQDKTMEQWYKNNDNLLIDFTEKSSLYKKVLP